MSLRVHVLMKKEEIEPARLSGKVVVVIDVLFATTTIVTALAHGATHVVPAAGAEAARQASRSEVEGGFVLAGELGADPIPGFANASPLALLREVPLEGKALVYSTTNGTVALANAAGADHVYAAALVNAAAVAARIEKEHPNATVVLACAGSAENFNLEDFYGAGCLAAHFGCDPAAELSDAALAARRLYESAESLECLRASRVGRMMIARGLDAEVKFAATRDRFAVVPRLGSGRLTDASQEKAHG